MRWVLSFLLFCFAIAGCAGGGSSGTGAVDLRGIITDSEGNPRNGASVALFNPALPNAPFAEILTGEEGEFFAPDVPLIEEYDVLIVDEGTRANVTVSSRGATDGSVLRVTIAAQDSVAVVVETEIENDSATPKPSVSPSGAGSAPTPSPTVRPPSTPVSTPTAQPTQTPAATATPQPTTPLSPQPPTPTVSASPSPTPLPEGECRADLNGDGVLDQKDADLFQQLYLAQDPSADYNGDGVVNGLDVGAYLNDFSAGCE
ncbi:MAG: hypothetical protein KDD64_10815 [Bdellovibrionales bacterium]|nr:hypothetical protein [Bdellovibrionales bacterium]